MKPDAAQLFLHAWFARPNPSAWCKSKMLKYARILIDNTCSLYSSHQSTLKMFRSMCQMWKWLGNLRCEVPMILQGSFGVQTLEGKIWVQLLQLFQVSDPSLEDGPVIGWVSWMWHQFYRSTSRDAPHTGYQGCPPHWVPVCAQKEPFVLEWVGFEVAETVHEQISHLDSSSNMFYFEELETAALAFLKSKTWSKSLAFHNVKSHLMTWTSRMAGKLWAKTQAPVAKRVAEMSFFGLLDLRIESGVWAERWAFVRLCTCFHIADLFEILQAFQKGWLQPAAKEVESTKTGNT